MSTLTINRSPSQPLESASSNRSEISSSSPTAEQSGGPIAGHVSNLRYLGAEGIAKIATHTEADVYKEYAEPLKGILPDILDTPLSRESQEKVNRLREPRAHETLIRIAAIGHDIPVESKVQLDVKIGKSTASKTQLKEEKEKVAEKPLSMRDQLSVYVKKAKMSVVADHIYGSSSRGYRLEGMGTPDTDSSRPLSRRALARNSDHHIESSQSGMSPESKKVLNEKLVKDLKHIQSVMQSQDITFVSSSLFFAIDKDRPENSQVGLIDPAHPIKKRDDNVEHFTRKQDQYAEGIESLIETFSKLANT